jgi:mycothiol system anti-sigma-R factor
MKLTCDDLSAHLHYYIDNELDEAERAELETHLSECSSCRTQVEFHLRLKQEIKTQIAAERAPEALRSRILGALSEETALRKPAPVSPRSRIARASLAAAAAAATILLLVLPGFTIAPAASDQLPVIKQTVDWHRGDFPLDIQTSDSVQASRWFRDKVDFPVRLPRFDVGRARLIGARLANVQDRRAVYALYEVDGGQRVSVMMFHGDGLTIPSDKIKTIADHDIALMRSHGFDVAVLQDQGITYTFTSDLPDADFVSLMSDSLRR